MKVRIGLTSVIELLPGRYRYTIQANKGSSECVRNYQVLELNIIKQKNTEFSGSLFHSITWQKQILAKKGLSYLSDILNNILLSCYNVLELEF